jgi:hypothetical protein
VSAAAPGAPFVGFDLRLRDAAHREGFAVAPGDVGDTNPMRRAPVGGSD